MLHVVLVFGVFAFACSEPWAAGILKILIAVLFAMTARARRLIALGPSMRFLLPGLVFISALGLLQSLHPQAGLSPRTIVPFTVSAWATRQAAFLWLSYGALVAAAAGILEDTRSAKRVAWTVFALALMVSILGIGFRSEDPYLMLGFRRVTHGGPPPFGPFVNRNHAADFLAIGGALGWGILFSYVASFRTPQSFSKAIDRAALALLTLGMNAAIIFGIYATRSRGGMHAFLLASGLMALASSATLFHGWRRATFLVLMLISGAVYAFLIYTNPSWRGTVEGSLDSSVQVRLSIFESGVRLLRDFPVFGIGLGGLRFAFPPYQHQYVEGLVEHAHNDWLEFAIETGAVGFLAITAGFMASLAAAVRRWSASTAFENKALRAGAVGALLAVFVHMFMEFPFQMPGLAVVVLVLSCLAARGDSASRGEEPVEIPGAGGWGRAGAYAFSAVLVAVSFRPTVGDYFYLKGKAAEWPSRVYYLSNALAWDPNPRYALALGREYLALARANPGTRAILLQKATEVLSGFWRDYPADVNLARLRSEIDATAPH